MTDSPFAITLDVGSSRANHTGSWRVERPVYVERMPPCNDAWPAGENVQRWLYEAEAGGYERAWRRIVEENPFPAVMGRACYHPCEGACNRGSLDEAVGIRVVERFLGDLAVARQWALPAPAADPGMRVLVVGGGPAGLSAAYHLRRLGHAVTIIDAAARLGGMFRYGIPAYRLPRQVLEAEIDRIVAMGMHVELGRRVVDLEAERRAGGFDAVFVGVGAQLARRIDIPAGDSPRLLDAISLLRRVAAGDPPLLGRRVAVYGGGDTALDAARTLRRLGATEAVVIYRRNRQRMPAHAEELDEALSEGVTLRWLSTVDHLEEDRIVVERMRLDERGVPEPTGEVETLGADALVLALGQEADLSLLASSEQVRITDGVIEVCADMMTAEEGIFAGGDAVPGGRTATRAIGQGKRAARGIDAYLSGRQLVDPARHELATFEYLNTWYYADAPRTRQVELDAARRTGTFSEVVASLTEENALFEARRCLSCGNCFGCDNCFGVCPDNAVIKQHEGEYVIDLDFCKGCGICATECPCGAIEMVPERI